MSRHRGPGQVDNWTHLKARDQRCWGVEVLTLFEFCSLWCANMGRPSREMSFLFRM